MGAEDEYMPRDDLQYVEGDGYDGDEAYLDAEGNINHQEYDYNNMPQGVETGAQMVANVQPARDLSPEERNPRRYAGMPSCWTRRIQPAGKMTHKSEGVSSVIGTGVA